MLRIQIGQPRVGKTKVVKKMINESKKRKLIFDFNNDFNDIKGVIADLESYHPLMEDLTLEEVKILNAGYLQSSRCLYRKAEDIFRETKEEKLPNIIQESIERLSVSLDDKWGEPEYARQLVERIPKKIILKQKPLTHIIELLEENEVVIVKSKSIHSDHLRAMMYMLLYKVSQRKDLDVNIIADEVSTLFFKGNIKLLFEVIDSKSLDIVISCNRPSNIPKTMKPIVDEWALFKNTDKSEVRYLSQHFDVGKEVDFANIPVGKYEIHK
ncbi:MULTISPECIES: hypothetical protein [Bacillus cereus group]|uniref:Uncharacterized protein n=1 Tax=Bacillus thuringiensis TaxID=1428 RepID=A0A9X6WH93_BACTU|nr:MULTISPECIES: hypothetical protein [Bacillus cereus group]MDA1674550.1 hypothetical protein [Bacillus cereus group sp. TH152-1LC]PFJ30267.1 hypothetical protein COJ15_31160 [Bacillus thuringiensis]